MKPDTLLPVGEKKKKIVLNEQNFWKPFLILLLIFPPPCTRLGTLALSLWGQKVGITRRHRLCFEVPVFPL